MLGRWFMILIFSLYDHSQWEGILYKQCLYSLVRNLFVVVRCHHNISPYAWFTVPFAVCYQSLCQWKVLKIYRMMCGLSTHPCLGWICIETVRALPSKDIPHKDSIGPGKCNGWPFHDLYASSWLWHWSMEICLSAWWIENHWPNYYLANFWSAFLYFQLITFLLTWWHPGAEAIPIVSGKLNWLF